MLQFFLKFFFKHFDFINFNIFKFSYINIIPQSYTKKPRTRTRLSIINFNMFIKTETDMKNIVLEKKRKF